MHTSSDSLRSLSCRALDNHAVDWPRLSCHDLTGSIWGKTGNHRRRRENHSYSASFRPMRRFFGPWMRVTLVFGGTRFHCDGIECFAIVTPSWGILPSSLSWCFAGSSDCLRPYFTILLYPSFGRRAEPRRRSVISSGTAGRRVRSERGSRASPCVARASRCCGGTWTVRSGFRFQWEQSYTDSSPLFRTVDLTV